VSGHPSRTDDARPGAGRQVALCDRVSVLFTERAGGVSSGRYSTLNLSDRVGDDPAAVAVNRDRLLKTIGPGAQRLAWMRQVHGAGVMYVGGSPGTSAGSPPGADAGQDADAAFTDVPGVALGVMAADCAPVLVADPAAGIVGAAHAGRPGMAAGVVPALISAMSAAGANVARMRVIVGPCICGRCYEVPAGMRADVEAAVPGSATVTRSGTPGIDVRAGLHGQLANLGIASVVEDARCTAESAELFSYRRDGTTGRFAGLIWLAP
jgi:purine-nucleoside/S-methyl-5'-thioadenosine phosphorylase / adenosine deaminase